MKFVRFGTGHAFRIPSPFGLTRSGGMILPWKQPFVLKLPGERTCPHCEAAADCGSLMKTGILLPAESLRVINGLFGSSSSLKSPLRIFIVGTVSNPLLATVEPDSRK